MISLIGRFACLIAFGMQLIATNEVQEVLDELTKMRARSLLMGSCIDVDRGTGRRTFSEVLRIMAMLEIRDSKEFVQKEYGGYGLTFINTKDIPKKALDEDFADCQTKTEGPIQRHSGQYIVTLVQYQGQDGFILTSKNNGELCFVKNNAEGFLEEYMPFTQENIPAAIEGAQIVYDALKEEFQREYEGIREDFEDFIREANR